MIHCKTKIVFFLPVKGDIVFDKVGDIDDDSVTFTDIDCWPGELPIDGHQRFRVAKACHVRILHLLDQFDKASMIRWAVDLLAKWRD